MYEIWLGVNILYELAWMYAPLVCGVTIMLALGYGLAWQRGGQWRAALTRTDGGQRDGPGVGAAAAHTDPLVAGGDGLLDRLAEPAAHQRRRRGAVRLAGVAVCRHASGGCLPAGQGALRRGAPSTASRERR